jgi:hypothetical protein
MCRILQRGNRNQCAGPHLVQLVIVVPSLASQPAAQLYACAAAQGALPQQQQQQHLAGWQQPLLQRPLLPPPC